jgi:hypothetical protein
MLGIITVVTEVNCSYSPDLKASIWIVKGDATAGERDCYPDEDPNAFRLFGPQDAENVRQLEQTVKDLFTFLGFEVRSDTVADD